MTYRLASIFEVRPAGVAFDMLLRLGTPVIAEQARALLRLDDEIAAIAARTVERLPEIENAKLRGKLKSKLMRRVPVAAEHAAAYPVLAPYAAAIAARVEAEATLTSTIEAEYERIHVELHTAGSEALPDFFVIESDGDANDRLLVESMTHNKWDRQNDRTLALYLQRVCAKNDSISRFGPSAWGKVIAGEGVHVAPRPAIAGRRVELERWVIQALIDVMNSEPRSRLEAAPRLHPHLLLADDGAVRLDEDRAIALTAEERATLQRCDGKTPAHALEPTILDQLVTHGAIVWGIEPYALDTSPLASLQRDVDGWRETPHREAWRSRLERLATFATRFGVEVGAPARRRIVAQLQSELEQIGVQKRLSGRTLYQARTPLNENCLQDVTITMGERTVAALVEAATPWFDLYADAVGVATSRIYHSLLELVREAPRTNGRLAYSTLARLARARKTSIEDDTLQEQAASAAWQDIKHELGAHLAGRADAAEWVLTAADCHILRGRHAGGSTGELVLPSADLQVIAASPEDAEAGRLEWIISELHWGPAPLQHSSYWCCPDKPALHAIIREIHDHRPFCSRDAGRFVPVHVVGEATLTAMPSPTYAGSGRPKATWNAVRPADVDVVVDEERCDIRLRAHGKDLGSIVRTTRGVGAMHPFFPLERVPHTPRLRVGDVIVQRQTWRVESTALDETRPHGVSPAFVASIERMRADREIPRWVFVRPAPGVLASRGSARDKDNKPMYVDLESAVFLDILERRLRKYQALAFTEMLPAPDALVWTLPDGRYTFEIRTNIIRGPER